MEPQLAEDESLDQRIGRMMLTSALPLSYYAPTMRSPDAHEARAPRAPRKDSAPRAKSAKSAKSAESASRAPHKESPPHEQAKECELPITLSSEQGMILHRAVAWGQSMFITGKAGTGKTTLLKEIIRAMNEKYEESHVYVTSSTGVSACHLGGTTVHSYGGIGLGEETVDELFIKMFPPARNRWRATKVLIIDEISMLRPDTFDKLEELARRVRRSRVPFGGIQVIACGDFYQLAPVYKDGEEVRYCFEAKSWGSVIQHAHELKTVYRQHDPEFLSVLDDIRVGRLSRSSIEILNKRVSADIEALSEKKIRPSRLRSHRATVQQENNVELAKLTTPGFKSTADDWGKTDAMLQQLKASCQAPEVLYMRAGAQVLLLRNLNVTIGLCNGAIGVITQLINGEPEVEFSSGQRIVISKCDWEIKSGKEVLAKRTQFPLTLGWSVTIHKSQGMTLEYADVELSGLFAAGQGYTALSRVRSLEGLTIDCVPRPDSFEVSGKVVEFYKSIV